MSGSLLLLLALAVSGEYSDLFPSTLSSQDSWDRRAPSPGQHSFSQSNNLYQPAARGLGPLTGGTSLQFAMKGYSNPGSRTPDGGICYCPPSMQCGDVKCTFTFTFIISTPGRPTRILETPEVRLDENGDAPVGRMEEWGRVNMVPSDGRPSSLVVLVHQRGLTVDETGRPKSSNQLLLVDSFEVDLEGVLPSVGQSLVADSTRDFVGSILGTRMSLSLSLACSSALIGPHCDLFCARSSINTNVASCRSNATGYFAICNWGSSGSQVENCKRCPWGVKEDTYCQDEEGGVLEPATAGVVDTSYRTATIVLSLLLLVLLVVLGVVIFLLCCRRRNAKSDPLPGHNVRASEAATQRPLLQSSYQEEAPTPLPRSGLPKSALRRPLLPPPAHLGGSNSVNDTLNSSFSEVPMRPSRSEIV